MTTVLVATPTGCETFTPSGKGEIELAGRDVNAVVRDEEGGCLALVDGTEIWQRRAAATEWSKVAVSDIPLQSILSVNRTVFGGGRDEAAIVRFNENGQAEHLRSFDRVPGRDEWFANGPPLGVRALTATAGGGGAILAAIHVGGIARSTDAGETWLPTIPVQYDVHEVCAHRALPTVVAAATAVGLCVSRDRGASWRLLTDGLTLTDSLAVSVLLDEALFSIQDGPFAKQSQIWRWRMDSDRLEPVRDGLPEYLDGKVDTAHIAEGAGRAAIVDGGGTLWLSTSGSTGWRTIGTVEPYVYGVTIL